MSLVPGFRLGPYEILSPLGAGGMGEVYRAHDRKLDRDVAVKVLPSHLTEDAEALARFEREAKAVAALSHPGLLAIHDFGREGEAVYAVMELLEGRPFASAWPRVRSRCARRWSTGSRSPAPWPRRTPRGSCTATSSRRTSSSPGTDG